MLVCEVGLAIVGTTNYLLRLQQQRDFSQQLPGLGECHWAHHGADLIGCAPTLIPNPQPRDERTPMYIGGAPACHRRALAERSEQ